MEGDRTARVGVISDTHGFLRSQVFGLFADVDRILHAGDVGDPAILKELEVLAPVTAVWGNVDGCEVRQRVPEAARGELAGVPYAVVHGHQVRDYRDLPERFPDARLVVHGHSHVPAFRRVGGGWLLNPGSAGPRRLDKPVTAAVALLREGDVTVRHVNLETGKAFLPGGGGG